MELAKDLCCMAGVILILILALIGGEDVIRWACSEYERGTPWKVEQSMEYFGH